VTEFACGPWDPMWQSNQQFHIDYMNQAIQLLENDNMVFRYSWFAVEDQQFQGFNNVFDNTGHLTDLGNQYASSPCGPFVSALEEESLHQKSNLNDGSSVSVIPTVLIVGVSVLVFVIIGVIIGIIYFKKFSRPAQNLDVYHDMNSLPVTQESNSK